MVRKTQKCVACNNCSQDVGNTNIIFHTFPRNPQQRNLWLKRLNLTNCYNFYRVCSKHFTSDDYKPGYKRWLLHNAVPKIDECLTSNNTDNSSNNIDNFSNNINNTRNNYDNAPENINHIDNTLNNIENTSDNIENSSNYTDNIVNASNNTDNIVNASNNTDNIVNASNNTDNIVNASNNTDNIVNASNYTDNIVNASNNTDNIVNASNNTDNIVNASIFTDSIINASNNTDNIVNASNNTDNIVSASNNTDNIVIASNNTDNDFNSTQPLIGNLVYTNNAYQIEQTQESNDMSTENSITNNLKSPRRSSRKVKPVTANDFVTFKNISLYQNNGEKRTSLKSQINIPKRKISTVKKIGGLRCSVKNCKNEQSQNISLFGYPLFNKSLREIWIQNCGIQDLVKPNEKFKSNLKVCGYHFEDAMFLNPWKRNRLKRNAVPRLFYNDLSNTPENCFLNENSEVMDETSKIDVLSEESKEFQSLTTMSESSNSQFKENINDLLVNTHSELIYNTRDPNCCIPGCVNHADYDKTIKNTDNSNSISYYTPPSNEVINDWSSILGVSLTSNSLLCERHFKPEDIISINSFTDNGIFEKRSLLSGVMPIILKPENSGLKRQMLNDDDDNLSLKKSKIDFTDDSQVTTTYTNLSKCEDTEPVNVLSTTSTDDPMSSNTQSSFTQLLPKILSNKSLSITLQSNVNNSIQITEKEFNKISKPTVVLLPSTNSKHAHNIDVHTSTSTNDSISDSSLSKFKQTPTKTSSICPPSVSITLESSNKLNGQISTIESTKNDHHTGILQLNTESVNILKPISANCSLTNSSKSNIEEILSKTLNNNSLSITLESNTTKQNNKKLLNSNSTNVINSTAILKSLETIDDTLPIIVIDDDDDDDDNEDKVEDDSIFESDYSQSSFEKLPPKTSKQKLKQNEQMKTIVSNKLIYPTILNATSKQNLEHINILPSTSTGTSTLPSYLKRILSKNSANNSLSISLKSNENITTSSNRFVPKTMQSYCKQNKEECATSLNVSDQLSLNTKKCPNNVNQITISSFKSVQSRNELTEMVKHNLFDCYSNCNQNISHADDVYKRNKEVTFNNISSIIKICDHILYPNFLWLCRYNIGLNKIMFIYRESSNAPVKKIEFNSSLIPNIYINSKQYEYNIAVKTKLELEDLLEKIDDIDVCLGYDGYTHEQCVGYFENPVGENEVCDQCKDLLKDCYLSRIDMMLKNKLMSIKNLENNIAEREVRVLQARETFKKKQKREEIHKAFNVIHPYSFFKVVKPPEYV